MTLQKVWIGLTAFVLTAVTITALWIYVNQNWYWLVLGHHPDTLIIRCEQEQNGVLIYETCFKKDAVIWPASEAPR